MDPVIFASVCLILAVATTTDLRSQRIPNALTFPAVLAALVYHLLAQGPQGLWISLTGLGLGLGLMLAPFLFGVMGGGDAKLMAALGAWLGPEIVLPAFLFTSLAGGLYALMVLARRRDVLRRLGTRLWTALCTLRITGSFAYEPVSPHERPLPRLCYGVAIALGTGAAMLEAVREAGWLGLAGLAG